MADDKLPGARGFIDQYFHDHPKRAEYLRPAVEGITSMFGVPTEAERMEQVKQQISRQNLQSHGLSGYPESLAPPGPNETIAPKGQVAYSKNDELLKAHEKGRAFALQKALGKDLDLIHQRLGMPEEGAETAIHNFADSNEGRSITEQLLAGKQPGTDVRAAYAKFVKEWLGDEKAVDKQSSRTLELDDPVVLSAAREPPAEIARAVMGAGGKPVVINEADDYGFRAGRVVVMPRKNGAKKVDPSAAADSVEPPVITPEEFIDVVKMIRGG